MDPDRLHRNTKYRGELEQDINLQTFDLIKCQTEVLNRKKRKVFSPSAEDPAPSSPWVEKRKSF